MWWKSLHHSASKIWIRTTSTAAQQTTRDNPASKIVSFSQYYGKECRDPIFTLVNYWLPNWGKQIPGSVLRDSGLSESDIVRWRPVFHAQDWSIAIPLFERRGVVFKTPDISRALSDAIMKKRIQPPSWIVFTWLCHRVKSVEDAHHALALACYHFPAASPHLRPALIIFAAGWLARYDQLAVLDRLSKAFLQWSSKAELKGFELGLLLQVISHFSVSKEASRIAFVVLEAVRKRHVALDENTYDAILKGRIVNPSLASRIFKHMQAFQYQPTKEQLMCLIRQFALAKRQRAVERCIRLLQRRGSQSETTAISGNSADSHTIASIPPQSMELYLSTFQSPHDIYNYLRHSPSSSDGKYSGAIDNAGIDHDDVTTVGGDSATESFHQRKRRQSLPMLPKDQVLASMGTWRSTLRIISENKEATAAQIVRALKTATEQHPDLHRDMTVHLFAMQGFLRRKHYRKALTLWLKILKYKLPLSAWAITVGAETLVAGNYMHRALSLLYEFAQKPTQDVSSSERDRDLVDTQTINVFMTALLRRDCYDMIFDIWDNMELLFDVRPDRYSLTILLKAARYASKCKPTIQGTLVELGLGGLMKQPTVDGSLPRRDLRQQIFSRTYALLMPESERQATGLWKGERAGVVALRRVEEILFRNYPELKNVEDPPLHAIRPSADFVAASPVVELFRSIMRRPLSAERGPIDIGQAEDALSSGHEYERILPSDVVFRAYIDLLSTESRLPQIPLVLAWMRHLGIKPSEHTLATVLVYWAEVSMDAPLVERWKGGQNEYAKMVQWLIEWVGEENMPTPARIGDHIHRLKYFRDSGRPEEEYEVKPLDASWNQ